MLQIPIGHLPCLFPSGFFVRTGRCLLLCSLALALSLFVPEGHAQQSSNGSSPHWIDGVTVGIGINTFHGDVDSDDASYTFLRTLTTAGPNVRLGVDRRFGPRRQFGVSTHLVYDRIYGEGPQLARFTNNLLSLEVQGGYEIPGVNNLFRLFAGGGPTLVVHPSYWNLTSVSRGDPTISKKLGSRVVGTVVVGFTIADRIRIGTRVSTTDYLDGLRASGRNQPVDILGFVSVGYRFDLSN